LRIAVSSDWPWEGELVFGRPRHAAHMNMPSDYPRINQFPEWFTIGPDENDQYRRLDQEKSRNIWSEERSVPLQLDGQQPAGLVVERSP